MVDMQEPPIIMKIIVMVICDITIITLIMIKVLMMMMVMINLWTKYHYICIHTQKFHVFPGGSK